MASPDSHVGLVGWFRAVVLHRCPRCGAKLVRRGALDESYTVTEVDPLPSSRGEYPGPSSPHGLRIEKTRIPVYLECPKCGFRVHLKDIES